MKKPRLEHDSIGKIGVAMDLYWGAQTQRALSHFNIGPEPMPTDIIFALALIKKAAAEVNSKLNLLGKNKAKYIIRACDDVIANKLDNHFPLTIWQSGSGTQTNMNLNEVIANRAIELMGGKLGSKTPIHPNDDVNMSQSTNDVFPTAMHIAALTAITKNLLPAIKDLHKEIQKTSEKFKTALKIGRTHLQDAAPITLGQEFSGYATQIKSSIVNLKNAIPHLQYLAIGGTAVGTGLNAPKQFDKKMAAELSKLSGLKLKAAPNKFAMLASHEALLITSSAIKTLATVLFKIANDIRWLASGPNCGLGELVLPSNEPGSSIMPGKVNPTQCEMMLMVCAQIIGNDTTVSFANSQGDLELNIFKPIIIYNVLQSIDLLSNACSSFNKHALQGLKANYKKLDNYLANSLMTVTALNPVIGYDKSCEIAKYAAKHDITLRAACIKLGHLTPKKFDQAIKKITGLPRSAKTEAPRSQ
ncbi:MAG: class II fumarate hydratase [Gammaproteobacteria bacterium]|nr:class II fumarate hydratase [Gammaproteobacteria bacterium]